MNESILDELEEDKPLLEDTNMTCSCVSRNFLNCSARSNTLDQYGEVLLSREYTFPISKVIDG